MNHEEPEASPRWLLKRMGDFRFNRESRCIAHSHSIGILPEASRWRKIPISLIEVVKFLISVLFRLWYGRTIQKKGHHFFEYFFADVYGTVDAVAWL